MVLPYLYTLHRSHQTRSAVSLVSLQCLLLPLSLTIIIFLPTHSCIVPLYVALCVEPSLYSFRNLLYHSLYSTASLALQDVMTR